ncbi:hypothetical protein GQ600_21521 [Phytophthora cactorum]|nr:hypothetical protein GQ600_21521 [Phytophthora cactorum]
MQMTTWICRYFDSTRMYVAELMQGMSKRSTGLRLDGAANRPSRALHKRSIASHSRNNIPLRFIVMLCEPYRATPSFLSARLKSGSCLFDRAMWLTPQFLSPIGRHWVPEFVSFNMRRFKIVRAIQNPSHLDRY